MSQPRKTFQNLSAQKKERITRAAIEEFAAKGFDSASINTIVERLNIAKGSIFQYFGDKKGLFMFVFNQSVKMVKNYLRSVRDQSMDEALPARLEKTLSAGVRFIKSHPLLYRLYLRVLSDAKLPFRDEILLSLRKYSLEFLESLLETANIRGELKKNIQKDKAAFMMDGIMDRFLQANAVQHLDAGLGIFNADAELTNEWIFALVEFICSGIGKPSVFNETKEEKNEEPELSGPHASSHILILAATENELSGLICRLESPVESPTGVKKVFFGKIKGKDVKILVTGPGLVNTSQGLTAAIELSRPLLVIQTGCAGAFQESGLKVGDIAIATKEIDAQLGIESLSDPDFPEALPFILFESETGGQTNQYPVDAQWLDRAYASLKPVLEKSGINMVKGPFITVSTITASDSTAHTLFTRFNAVVEQMEGSASSHVSALYGIPFMEIRGISNMVGKRDKKSWDLSVASKNCCDAIFTLIQNPDSADLK